MSYRCVNCTLSVARIQKHRLSEANPRVLDIVSRWVYPHDVTPNDYVCHACWELMHFNINQALGEGQSSVSSQVGHHAVCITCGRSIARIRRQLVLRSEANENERKIIEIIARWIWPRELTSTDQVCYPCWLKGKRAAERQLSVTTITMSPVPNVTTEPQSDDNNQINIDDSHEGNEVLVDEQILPVREPDNIQRHSPQIEQVEVHLPPVQQIVLPNIRRAANTGRRCLFITCNNQERHHISDGLRKRILKDYNYYIPRNARVCGYHLNRNIFHQLYLDEGAISSFTAEQIEEIIFLLSEETIHLDFINIENMEDQLFLYWFGLRKVQYRQLLIETPRINTPKLKCGLNALLCKMRTGDSDLRISTLFGVPRRTLEGYMHQARTILVQDFVPQHLSFRHMTREQLVTKNTILADNLFGDPDASLEEKPLILIADGTYIYTQKSSNYAFQKNTYSLHKYHNLLKPFVIVTCDGYIVDVVGPYAATKNDANIMIELLDTMREFLRDGDIFILDRGFRDCVDTLSDSGYIVHMPEIVSEGERQLTTLEANRSRCVTMNRWVVEAVNGRFGRDFKIFREDYFNKRCPYMMQEFSIAAALINTFAIQFAERRDANQIINIIYNNLYRDNILAQFVDNHNLNMRSAVFHSVTASNIPFPELSVDDLELIALGTYQIRQAKSYVGEHLRVHGLYRIEVCRMEVGADLFNGIDPFILRCKIKSRHIGGKTYFIYIVVDRVQQGRGGLLAYCCNCPVGRRTVGCCSHVMSVLWYMGYARRQAHISAPAAMLDDVIVQ